MVVGEAAEFWCNVPARLAMHRPQPFQKPVNVVVVEDAGQRQLGGGSWSVMQPMSRGQCRRSSQSRRGAALCPR